MSKQEDFHGPENPLEKTREIDKVHRISKEAETKRKFNRNQKRIYPWDIQLTSLIFLLWASCNFLEQLFLESSENSYFGIFLLVKRIHFLWKCSSLISAFLGDMFKFQNFVRILLLLMAFVILMKISTAIKLI